MQNAFIEVTLAFLVNNIFIRLLHKASSILKMENNAMLLASQPNQRTDWSCNVVYAVAEFCWINEILFAAFNRFCPIAAIAICAWVLSTPKYRARCNPNNRFMVPKHCSILKRVLEINLLNRFSEARKGRLRTALL